ncbi:START domain-containing protein 10 [Gryganskiella cystojenkinii]|nr:START domain-containing protein 10 [Gryganskiella cystojenkinii]
MVDTTQSPLAMLVLVTPYTILYVVNELFLHGILDRIHYLFFELIFVLAFRRVFGLPDLAERFFPARFLAPNSTLEQKNVQTVEGVQPIKTTLATGTDLTGNTKPTTQRIASTADDNKTAATTATLTTCTTLAGTTLAKSTTTNRPIVGAAQTATAAAAHPYAQDLLSMEHKFMDYINNSDIWDKVYEDKTVTPASKPGEPWIEVFQYKERPMCYKIMARMNSSAAVTFDTLCDLDRRSDWDPMCVEARVLENVKTLPGTTVQYVRTKAVWPTASRDTVVLGTIKELKNGQLFMVNASVQHASMPERIKEKIVRMETAVAGHIITPEGPSSCRLVQVLDADLKGWIPDKVIQMVSTKAVPDGLRAVNALIPKVTSYSVSKSLAKAAKDQMELETTLQDPRRGNYNSESMLEGHTNDLELDPEEVELPREDNENKIEDKKTNLENQDDDDDDDNNDKGLRATESNISLSALSERLRALETEMGMGLRSRPRAEVADGKSKIKSSRSGNSADAGTLEKVKPAGSTFRMFWEGVKENFGLGLAGKANKILVAVLVVAILGSSLAKFKRR